MRDPSELPFKRGDELVINMVLRDKNNANSLMLYEILKKAEKQYAYDVYYSLPTSTSFQAVLDAQINYMDSTLVDITGWTISSQLRWSTKLIDDLTVTIVDAPNGAFNITAPPTKTTLWTPRKYDCDIELNTSEPLKVSSDTFTLNVIEDITQNG